MTANTVVLIIVLTSIAGSVMCLLALMRPARVDRQELSRLRRQNARQAKALGEIREKAALWSDVESALAAGIRGVLSQLDKEGIES